MGAYRGYNVVIRRTGGRAYAATGSRRRGLLRWLFRRPKYKSFVGIGQTPGEANRECKEIIDIAIDSGCLLQTNEKPPT